MLPMDTFCAEPQRIRHDFHGLGQADPVRKTLAMMGSLLVRLAESDAEIAAAQRLRYQVFCEERQVKQSAAGSLLRRDFDVYDTVCDHLIVIDLERDNAVVATYRLMPMERASCFGYYSEQEFDISTFLSVNNGRRLLELGRSCVAKSYRSRRAMELLWRGLWAYARARQIDVMFGCASLDGMDTNTLAPELAILRNHAFAPEHWKITSRSSATEQTALSRDVRAAPPAQLRLPPLIKAYMRLGAVFSDAVCVDQDFETTDVFVALDVSAIGSRYIAHYSA